MKREREKKEKREKPLFSTAAMWCWETGFAVVACAVEVGLISARMIYLVFFSFFKN